MHPAPGEAETGDDALFAARLPVIAWVARMRRRAPAILSRVRSAIISRSNSAKLMSMLSVSRPMASAVEKFWVTLTNATSDRILR